MCLTRAGRDGPRRLADYAGRLLAAALDGNLLPAGNLAKSPWGTTKDLIGTLPRLGQQPMFPERYAETEEAALTWWTLPGAGRAELRAVVAALKPHFTFDAKPRQPLRFDSRRPNPDDSRGRNCTLFNIVRYWAYARQERDGDAIHAEACRANALFDIPLPCSEVAGLARSVAKFMNSRYAPRFGSGSSRGRDASLTSGLPAVQAQAIAGRRTAEARRNRTDKKLEDGMAALRAVGRALTQSAVAEVSGLSLSTVKRHWKSAAVSPTGTNEVANSGCHTLPYQVMAPPGLPSGSGLPGISQPVSAANTASRDQRMTLQYCAYAARRAAQLSRRGFRLRSDSVIRMPTVSTKDALASWRALQDAFANAKQRTRNRRQRRKRLRIQAWLRGIARLRCARTRDHLFACHIEELCDRWQRWIDRWHRDPDRQQQLRMYCKRQIAARRRWWSEALQAADLRRT